MTAQNKPKPSELASHLIAERRFIELLDALPKVSVQGYDKHRRVIHWNRSSEEIYGYRREDALGQKLEDLIIPEGMRPTVIALHQQWIDKGIAIPSAELILQRKDGSYVPVFSSHIMLKQDTDEPEMFCVDVDLSEQYQAQQELRQRAITDQLTGLPNRRHLDERLKQHIEEQGENCQLALFFIDLDVFKEVNDTLGHHWGDDLLKAVAQRLSNITSEGELLARFGGDEFVLLMPFQHTVEVQVRLQQIQAAFSSPFQIGRENLLSSASIGISHYPQDSHSAEALLKNADLAMYHAKEQGHGRHQVFTPKMADDMLLQHALSKALHAAIDNDELTLYYQPIYDLSNHQIVACEALLRWFPQDERLPNSPAVFVPIAERSDLILHLGDWVLKQACQQAQSWQAQGHHLRIDINVSGKQVIQSDFFEQFSQLKQEHQLTAEQIGIELTEHTLIQSNHHLLEQLQALKDSGVEIAIDDFGTGYSSLNYLKTLPVTHLKIDRSFIQNIPESHIETALLAAVVSIGHQLNLDIIVEGIETEQQAEYCKSIGIDFAQGFLFCRPASPDVISEQLAQNNQD
ncbi:MULTISPECIES: bifunctional diguanylate cyclase/phosphodiesterase [unclassified Vibrio]|uniref:EAL domain-containing protein n=1 Tax=Vibrio sp. HB236076 TaxID=3232307 RepID=A0AB39HK40_9VIBR|nr:EAL domain-containing protein [Vibrio sp. HB161653]MDP5252910.1 EAL domain-containing protein [Vibrio sp. HB161653]